MANIEIDDLNAVNVLDDSTNIPVSIQGETKRITFKNFKSILEFLNTLTYNQTTGKLKFKRSNSSTTEYEVATGLQTSFYTASLQGSDIVFTKQSGETETLDVSGLVIDAYTKTEIDDLLDPITENIGELQTAVQNIIFENVGNYLYVDDNDTLQINFTSLYDAMKQAEKTTLFEAQTVSGTDNTITLLDDYYKYDEIEVFYRGTPKYVEYAEVYNSMKFKVYRGQGEPQRVNLDIHYCSNTNPATIELQHTELIFLDKEVGFGANFSLSIALNTATAYNSTHKMYVQKIVGYKNELNLT